MGPCDLKIEESIEARTHVGPNSTESICEIGDRDDIKHFVRMQSLHSFPIDISCFSRMDSESQFIQFRVQDAPEGTKIAEDNWTAIGFFDTDQEQTFEVGLTSPTIKGAEQDIKVQLSVGRWHSSYQYDLSFPTMTIIS